MKKASKDSHESITIRYNNKVITIRYNGITIRYNGITIRYNNKV